MHSTLTRVQNVFGFFTSVAFAVAAAIAVSVLLIPQAPSASLELKNVKVAKGRPHYYSTRREEYAHVTFDLAADLSSLFSWNTKQIFAYVVASYPPASASPSSSPPPSSSPAPPDNEAIIWDAIIPSPAAPFHPNTYIHPSPPQSKAKAKSKPKRRAAGLPHPAGAEPGILRLEGQKPKYQITTPSGRIAGTENATLTLHWNVQPWVGMLTWTNTKTYGRWEGLKGGRSRTFAFPEIKGSEGVKKEELKTEKGAERNRLLVG